jgi:hypothetical protein
MKNLFFPLLSALICVIFFTACDKADMKIKKLNHGDGTWTIESYTTEYFNAEGNSVDSTVTDESYGEIAFFKSTTLDALWDYHFSVIYQQDAQGHYHEFPCGVYFDGERAHIENNVYPENCPAQFLGLWTVEESSRRKQVWTMFTLRPADNSLAIKTTMRMKFK